jgi:hypothetical protein
MEDSKYGLYEDEDEGENEDEDEDEILMVGLEL